MVEPKASAAPAFQGPPGRLRWAQADLGKNGPPTAVHLPSALAPYADPRHPPLRAAGHPGRMRLRLAPHTPPGHYKVELEFAGGQRQELSVAVESRPRLHVVPGTLRLAGAPGGAASAWLALENRGNEPLNIGEALFCGLFDNGGIEAALAAVYRLETDNLNEVIATGFGRLRQAHGGLLKLRVREGAGTLAPGERRQVLIRATLSTRLAPGHGYHGTFEFGPHRIAVQVQVSDPLHDGANR